MVLALNQTNKRLIGLDVGSCLVKAVVLNHRETGPALRGVGLQSVLGPDPFRDPIDAEVIEAVQGCLRQLPGRESYACAALAGNEVVVRSFRFPRLAADEIEGAVQLEAVQVCPFDLQQSTLDYQLLETSRSADSGGSADEPPEGPHPVQGVLTLATDGSIQHRQRLVHRAGVKCALMDVEGLALLNAHQTLVDQPHGPRALLHVGWQRSIVAVLSPDGWVFVRDIGFGGRLIVEMISQRTEHTPAAIAESIAAGKAPAADRAVGHAWREAIGKLADEVRETLHYYSVQQSRHRVGRLTLTGGFSLVPGLAESLGAALGQLSIEPWNPLAALPDETGGGLTDALREVGAAFAVAVGLALRSV